MHVGGVECVFFLVERGSPHKIVLHLARHMMYQHMLRLYLTCLLIISLSFAESYVFTLLYNG